MKLFGYSLHTAEDLRTEYAPKGLLAGGVLLLKGDVAVEFIARAKQEYVAVVGVAPVPPDAAGGYATLGNRPLSDSERLLSWSQAHDLISGFTGRDLWFEVVLERPWATYWAHLKYGFRNHSPWK